jgi:hypothetical protein
MPRPWPRRQVAPFIYLSNSSQSKEQLARDIATRDRIEQGLVN